MMKQANTVQTYKDARILNDARLLDNMQQNYHTNHGQSYFNSVQVDIKPSMRKDTVSWMLEVCEEEECNGLVLPLAAHILDKYFFSGGHANTFFISFDFSNTFLIGSLWPTRSNVTCSS
jgi:hypothetical protein